MEKREEICFWMCYDVIVVSWTDHRTPQAVMPAGYFYARKEVIPTVDEALEARLRLGADRALDLMLETLQDPEAPLKQRVEVAQLMLDRVCGKGPRPAETGPVRVVLEGSAARCGM